MRFQSNGRTSSCREFPFLASHPNNGSGSCTGSLKLRLKIGCSIRKNIVVAFSKVVLAPMAVHAQSH
jgi:hypothetical protein